MPVEVISYMLSSEKNMMERLRFQLVLQCAPFFKGLKSACAVSLGKAACSGIRDILSGTGVEHRILAERDERCLVFFYRERELEQCLSEQERRVFLADCGYEVCGIALILGRLSERMRGYFCGKMEFPHEMGVILGYPVEDVRCFIRENGRNSLFGGYWKVYHNPCRAKMTFDVYDKAKLAAVNEYLAGGSMRDIICATDHELY